MATVGPLWKTTLVVWSKDDPNTIMPSMLVSDMANAVVVIEMETQSHPEHDEDWDDDIDVFGDPVLEMGEPGGTCEVCWGKLGEWEYDHQEQERVQVGDTCPNCNNTGIEPEVPAQEIPDPAELYNEANSLEAQATKLLEDAKDKRRLASKVSFEQGRR